MGARTHDVLDVTRQQNIALGSGREKSKSQEKVNVKQTGRCLHLEVAPGTNHPAALTLAALALQRTETFHRPSPKKKKEEEKKKTLAREHQWRKT